MAGDETMPPEWDAPRPAEIAEVIAFVSNLLLRDPLRDSVLGRIERGQLVEALRELDTELRIHPERNPSERDRTRLYLLGVVDGLRVVERLPS